jgi:hypothetical protein
MDPTISDTQYQGAELGMQSTFKSCIEGHAHARLVFQRLFFHPGSLIRDCLFIKMSKFSKITLKKCIIKCNKIRILISWTWDFQNIFCIFEITALCIWANSSTVEEIFFRNNLV